MWDAVRPRMPVAGRRATHFSWVGSGSSRCSEGRSIGSSASASRSSSPSLIDRSPHTPGLLTRPWSPQRPEQARSRRLVGTLHQLGHTPASSVAGHTRPSARYFALIYFCLQVAVYGVTFFLPTPRRWAFLCRLDAADGVHDRIRRRRHRIDQLAGQPGRFLAPIQRDYFKETLGGNAGLYSLAIGAVLAAVLAMTAFFKKANEVEARHLDAVDAHYVPHEQAEAARGLTGPLGSRPPSAGRARAGELTTAHLQLAAR